jgi:hypothetical protein
MGIVLKTINDYYHTVCRKHQDYTSEGQRQRVTLPATCCSNTRESRRLKEKEVVVMAIRELLRRQYPDLQRDGVFQNDTSCEKFVSVLTGHFGKYK